MSGVLIVGGVMVLWLLLWILPLTWWRTRNLQLAWWFRCRTGHWCRHVPLPDDPPHWESPEPGTAWGWYRPLAAHPGAEARTCRSCGWEQRRPVLIPHEFR